VWAEQPRELIMAARGLLFVFLGLLFWYNRGTRLLPTSAAERELWTIWIGYFAAYSVSIAATRLLVGPLELLAPGVNAPRVLVETLPYPFIAAIAGLAFFTMGSNYWGRCYAIGMAFFTVAVVMPFQLDWAPLEFGLIWAAALTALGLHLRKLGKKAEAEKATQTPSAAETIQVQRLKT
jgi:hypothetical protein